MEVSLYLKLTVFIFRLKSVVEIMLIPALAISYAFQGFALVDIIWHDLFKRIVDKEIRHVLYEYITKFAIVILTSL